MLNLQVSATERLSIERFIKNAVSDKERARGKAILGLADGRSVDSVAEEHHVTRQSVYNWIHQFKARQDRDPVERLKTGVLGRPRKCRDPLEPIIAWAIERDPRSFGYESVFWSTSLLMRYLKEWHGIEATRTSVDLAIHRVRPLRNASEAPARSLPERHRQASASVID